MVRRDLGSSEKDALCSVSSDGSRIRQEPEWTTASSCLWGKSPALLGDFERTADCQVETA